jgi:hypothetical protein
MNVYTPDVEAAPSPSPEAYATRTDDVRASTSHAGAGITTCPPTGPPIPLGQLHMMAREIVKIPSHAGARITTHPPAEPPIPLEQSHTTTSEVTQVARAEPPPTIFSGLPASPQHGMELSPSQLTVVCRLAEQNVPAPTLVALINSLISEAEGGAGQINQLRQAGASRVFFPWPQRPASSI